MSPSIEDVFGVSSKPVLSYIERKDVDDRFVEALRSDKQIVVYGSSKQGKTSLVSTYLPYEKNIVVRLTPKTAVSDIYASVLRQSGIQIRTLETVESSAETEASVAATAKASIAIFGGDSSGKLANTESSSRSVQFEKVPFKLELPQDVSELMRRAEVSKVVILENFHYLGDETQRQFAFDLRTFQELGIRFVILGVWREKNRLAQFNGDLLDRLIEVPVEPWAKQDFNRVVAKGSDKLYIDIARNIVEKGIDCSFSSIGVFQELVKELCLVAGVRECGDELVRISDVRFLDQAITRKAEEYAARHQRALEAIAAGNLSTSAKEGIQPLFLPYYLVRVILEAGYPGLVDGMRRAVIQESIKAIHHRADDVRASDMSNLLYNLAGLQSNKDISPPIIDYDRNTKMLQVVDSTFYFFLQNANLSEIASELPNPLQDSVTK